MQPWIESLSGRWLWRLRVLMTTLACALADPVAGEPTHAVSPAASEAIVIIVNKANPVDNLSAEDLRKLFLGDRKHWPSNRKVTVALLDSDPSGPAAALKLICGLTGEEFKRHWLHATFTGEAQSGPKELATPAGLRRFIVNVPGAIGWLRARDVDDSVKVLSVEGRAPGAGGYRLNLPTK